VFDLVTVGHAARDEFAGETDWRLGGSAVYGAATAARLGARTALLTRVGPNERERLAARCAELGIELHALPSEATTTFAFRYDEGHRTLKLRARARGIDAAALPAPLRETRSVVLASIAHELAPSLFDAFASAARVLVAQGYLRAWDADGTVRKRDWEDPGTLLSRVDAAVLSEEDLGGDLAVARRWAESTAVIVTLAERGALAITRDGEVAVPSFAVERVVDPTGAGDAFAAGLALALADGRALPDAVRYANAVASFAVEGKGTEALGTAEQVEARMRG